MRLVSVIGSAPGVGKSTLCAAVTEHLRAGGRHVDHFDESDVLRRPEFAEIAAMFRADGSVVPATLVDATVAYVDGAAERGVEVVVVDALLPFVPTLLAVGRSEQDIEHIVDGLAQRIRHVDTLAVFLDGDAGRALDRAAAREGDGWLSWYGDKLARYRLVPAEPTTTDVCAYLAYERDVTMRVLEHTPWRVLVVDNAIDRPATDVLTAVVDELDRLDRLPQQ